MSVVGRTGNPAGNDDDVPQCRVDVCQNGVSTVIIQETNQAQAYATVGRAWLDAGPAAYTKSGR